MENTSLIKSIQHHAKYAAYDRLDGALEYDEEMLQKAALAELQEMFMKASEPFTQRLVEIAMSKPPAPIWITTAQAGQLDLAPTAQP